MCRFFNSEQMYKVFFNQKLIIITVSTNITLNQKKCVFVDAFSTHEIRNWWEKFVIDNSSEIVLVHQNPELFFELFRSVFILVPAAGGLVFKNNKLLIIFRNGKWDLPKGKIDKGETIENAAIREVEEECGIKNPVIDKKLPSTFHIFQSPYRKSKGKWILKETHWFEMNYNGETTGKPQLEEGITKIKWFQKNNLTEVFENTYENLKQIISIYLP